MLLVTSLWIALGTISVKLVLAAPPDHNLDNVVNLGYVKYLGARTFPNTIAFLGIPYAEPPVGDRRFRAPVPLNTKRVASETKGKVVDARSYDSFCVQSNGNGTEDCLKLNIWAPAGAKRGDNFPVLFYIHGGGYADGHPSAWPFDHWVEQSPNVVIVSVGYRLGVYGFLAEPRLANPLYGDFNAGFKDQIEGLKWVNKYISFFGGNPNTVTINGHSAGAHAVQLHLVSRQRDKAFHRAIAQSDWRAPLPSPQQVQPLFEFISTNAGCANLPFPATMACLRDATAGQLSNAFGSISTSFAGAYNRLTPVLDGQLFTEYPTESFLANRFTRVPLIIGATTNDSLVFGTDVESELKTWWPLLSDDSISNLLALYPLADFPTVTHRHRKALGDSQFICSRSILSTLFSTQSPTWAYRYNERNPTSQFPSEPGQVGHADENWLMFRGVNTFAGGQAEYTGLNPVQTAFSQELIAYWLSFVRSGDPNTYKLSRSPNWAGYAAANRQQIILQQDPSGTTTQTGITSETEPQEETTRCQFLTTLTDQYQA